MKRAHNDPEDNKKRHKRTYESPELLASLEQLLLDSSEQSKFELSQLVTWMEDRRWDLSDQSLESLLNHLLALLQEGKLEGPSKSLIDLLLSESHKFRDEDRERLEQAIVNSHEHLETLLSSDQPWESVDRKNWAHWGVAFWGEEKEDLIDLFLTAIEKQGRFDLLNPHLMENLGLSEEQIETDGIPVIVASHWDSWFEQYKVGDSSYQGLVYFAWLLCSEDVLDWADKDYVRDAIQKDSTGLLLQILYKGRYPRIVKKTQVTKYLLYMLNGDFEVSVGENICSLLNHPKFDPEWRKDEVAEAIKNWEKRTDFYSDGDAGVAFEQLTGYFEQ